MIFEDIQKAAWAFVCGKIDKPTFENGFDDTAFWKMSNAYDKFVAKKMTQEGCQEELVSIRRFWEIDKHYHATAMRTAQMYRDLELAVSQYRKEHTLDNADRSMEILYGFFNYIQADNASAASLDGVQGENARQAVSVDGQE